MAKQGISFGAELCKMLGLDANNIQQLEVVSRANDAPIITGISRHFVTEESVDALQDVTRRYKLVPIEPAEGP